MQENNDSSDHQPSIVDRDGRDATDHLASTESEGSSSLRSGRRRNLILVILLLLVAAAVTVPGWRYLSSYEDTDDAQVDGHIIAVSSRINGTIVGVYVVDTQPVREGQLLAEIDPADYVVAIEGARARLGQAQAQVESAKADYETALSKVSQDDATSAKAEYDVPRLEILGGRGRRTTGGLSGKPARGEGGSGNSRCRSRKR